MPSIARKTMKTLEFGLNEFVPSAAPFGVGKQAEPQQVSAPRTQLFSTPAALPSVAVLMKLPKMLLDKVFSNAMEWPDWYGQFLVSVKEFFHLIE